jgi:hypothetical protein
VPLGILLENYVAYEGLIWRQWPTPHNEPSPGKVDIFSFAVINKMK